MLQLLNSPRWVAVDRPAVALPATLPGGLLIYLAACGDGRGAWVHAAAGRNLGHRPQQPAALSLLAWTYARRCLRAA